MAETMIQGECEPRFEKVRRAFIGNFEQLGEVGAAVAVTLDGKPVVDLWGGHADKARTTPWARDTLVNVYSTTKGLTAICTHRLIERGKLELDAPVARYWPEFAQGGKQNLPVRFLLSHKAGMPAIRNPLPPEALFDSNRLTAELAAQEPWWEPGSRHGYHAVTFGWLLGELVRRVTGKTVGTYFREELAEPLQLDCHIGLAAQNDARVAPLISSPPPPPDQLALFAEIAKDPQSMLAKAFINPPSMAIPGIVNTREWRGAEIPAANGHSTARALARLYGALGRGGELDGVRVLSPESIARCHTEQSVGPDAILKISTRFGLGFMLSQPGEQFGPNPRAFGHPGAGGSVGFADPDGRIGFGYTMNRMGPSILLDPRAKALIEAVYTSL